MQLKVKDFATQMGVSESIIYRHIRQNQEELSDKVIKKPKATWLTDEAQDFLRDLMVQAPPPAVADAQIVADLAAAQKEIERLRLKLELKQDELNAALAENNKFSTIQARLETAEMNQKLLEDSREDYKKQAQDARQEAKEARQEADTEHREVLALRVELEDRKAHPWKYLFRR